MSKRFLDVSDTIIVVDSMHNSPLTADPNYPNLFDNVEYIPGPDGSKDHLIIDCKA